MPIFTCGVCHQLHEMGNDHMANEPCAVCWKQGWCIDLAGTVYRFYCKERVIFSKAQCGQQCRVCNNLDRAT